MTVTKSYEFNPYMMAYIKSLGLICLCLELHPDNVTHVSGPDIPVQVPDAGHAGVLGPHRGVLHPESAQ